ncbi:MAG TPA: DUF5682 family protein [Thermoanaerobaculia bacterium]|nr:DUF5682 family protein [Thermoanaerobaculia bacterium]
MSDAVHARVHLFPVRHHSPRTSLVLRRWLDRLRPALVLVEGPEDATPLIPSLTDPESQPPIAILGYRTDGTPGSALWPFAAYSPEYVALRWAAEAGVEARFIDISTGQSLARDVAALRIDASEPAAEPEESIWDTVAARAGFRSFEEFWEASFEAPDYDEPGFRGALLEYAELVRHEGHELSFHRARDAYMARRIREAAAVVAPETIVAVLGAAHAAALAADDVDDALLPALDATVPTTTTLIPYSFPRLAEQTGYGAGNRAPHFYQRAWDAGGSFRRAALEVLVDFSDHLRLRGFMSSLADTIEAYRLACMLADIRGKGEPGLDEVREATVATMCRGDATHVDTFLWPSVIGRNIGKVASRIGRNSLQEEFWREVEQRRLPRTDAPEEFVLKLGDPVQVATSVFLHRLRVADIPYASYRGASAGARATVDESAGGIAALTRVREAWQAQWTPSTDASLVERIVFGETLEQVCRRVLEKKLGEARTTSDAAGVLLESVVASVAETLSTALAACDRLASADDDLPSLATACRALSGLIAYGSSRESAALGTAAIPPLCVKTFDRAVLRVRAACDGNDEAVAPVKVAMRVLNEIALAQPIVDRAAWIEAAAGVAHDYSVHPGCAGIAAGLLYLAQAMNEEEVALLVGQRLSDALEPARAADFLAGFLEVNALVLVKSRPIVAALDAFLNAIDRDRFRDALPVLRRAFAHLGATERRYLVENIVALRKLGGSAGTVAQVIAAKDREKLESLSDDIAKAMDDLDDLL